MIGALYNTLTVSQIREPSTRPNKPILFRSRGQSNTSGNGANITDLQVFAPEYTGLIANNYVFNAVTGLFEQVNVGVNHNIGSDLNNDKFGTRLVFGKLASEYLGVNVHYLNRSFGSTGITGDPNEPDWLPENEELFTEANDDYDAAVIAMNNLYGVDGWIFSHETWGQGEDERFDPTDYSVKLDHFITSSNNYLGFQAKYLIEITQFNGIRLEQELYISQNKDTSFGVEIDNYVRPDGLHYDAQTMHDLAVHGFNVAKSYIWRN